MDWIDSLDEKIMQQFRRPTVSYETKQYANYRLRQFRPLYERVTRENAYEDHLLTYLQQEREKFLLSREDGEPEDILEGEPYGELRDDPVCTCDGRRAHRCPLKRGELPREVRVANDLDDGIREFRGSHTGNPIVLQDAQAEWADMVGELEQYMRELLAILASDEIPESADWPTDATETEQPAD